MAFYRKGKTLVEMNNYQAALVEFNNAIELDDQWKFREAIRWIGKISLL